MHAVDDLLTTMRIEDSRYVRITARAPWGIAFPSRHVARLILVTRGSCWLTGPGLGKPVALGAGECVLVRAGTTFELADEPGRELVDCDGITDVGGDGEPAELVSSRFSFDPVAADALFALLPPLYRISPDAAAGALLRATFDLIAAESQAGALGSGFVAGRLSDVLFVQALRACCDDAGGGTIGWLAALRDPALAAAIRAMHADLAHPWTVDELARAAGMSRSSFAAAFRATVGDTPLGYLTTWRMYRVKTLLRDTVRSVAEIAAAAGYRTGPALSRVFARREGCSPGQWRRQSADGNRGGRFSRSAATPSSTSGPRKVRIS